MNMRLSLSSVRGSSVRFCVTACLLLVFLVGCRSISIQHGALTSSIDGRRVAYVAAEVYRKATAPVAEPPLVTGTEMWLKMALVDGRQQHAIWLCKLPADFRFDSCADLLWASDSTRLLCRVNRDIWLADATAGTFSQVTRLQANEGVVTFAWTGSNSIAYATSIGLDPGDRPDARPFGHSPEGTGTAVYACSVDGDVPELLFRDEFTWRSVSCRSSAWSADALSRDGRYYVYRNDQSVCVVDLAARAVAYEHRELGSLYSVHWAPDSALCLIGLRHRPSGLDGLRVFLLDMRVPRMEEVTDRLRAMNNAYLETPFPDLGSRVWGDQGEWFCVRGTTKREGGNSEDYDFDVKNWLCRVHPWSSLCMQDVVGSDLLDPIPAPKGNMIAMAKLRNRLRGLVDLYVTEVQNNPSGDLALTKPVKVVESVEEGDSWVWDAEGVRLIVLRKGKVAVYPVRESGAALSR